MLLNDENAGPNVVQVEKGKKSAPKKTKTVEEM
jgi:hypothetical protein